MDVSFFDDFRTIAELVMKLLNGDHLIQIVSAIFLEPNRIDFIKNPKKALGQPDMIAVLEPAADDFGLYSPLRKDFDNVRHEPPPSFGSEPLKASGQQFAAQHQSVLLLLDCSSLAPPVSMKF